MNVLLGLPDELGRGAGHRAQNASKTLTAWITDLVAREVRPDDRSAKASLLEALGDDSLAEGEFEFPDRRLQPQRPPVFP